MQLEKGRLVVLDSGGGDAKDIEFMFNPQELSFTRESQWQSDVGVRTVGTGSNATEEGPKVNFGGIQAYTFSLNKLVFDTYETGTSVLEKYIKNIKKGVATPSGKNTRPPVYYLVWGIYDYFPCVMTSLTYTLTLFLNNGTPVRALVDISLLEVDKGALSGTAKKTVEKQSDTLEKRRDQINKDFEESQKNSDQLKQFEEQQRNTTQPNLPNKVNNLDSSFF